MSEKNLEDFDFDFDEIDELEKEINQNNLDKELRKQHTLFVKYSKLYALSKKVHNKKWERVKTIRSRIILDIKKKKVDKGEKAPTQQEIEATYRTNKRYKSAKNDMIDAEYDMDTLDGVVMSLHQRKSDLKDLVKLWLGEYWADHAGETLDADTREQFQKKKQKTVRKKVKEKLNK